MKKFALLYLPVAVLMVLAILIVGILLAYSDLGEMRRFQRSAVEAAGEVAALALQVPANNQEAGKAAEPYLRALLTSRGQWLLTIKPGDDSGLPSEDPERSFAAQNPAEWAFIFASPQGQKMTGTGLWTWTTMEPASILGGGEKMGESWRLVAHVPAGDVSRVAWAHWKPLLMAGVVALAIMAFGVWKYRRFWEQRERASAEMALAQGKQDAELKLRMATEGAGVGVWRWDVSSGRMDWSDVCKEHLALPPDTKPSMEHFYGVMHPDDRERVKQVLEESVARRQKATMESRIVHGDGSVHWITSRWRVYDNPDGSLAEISGITVDNTARRQAEEDLRELNLTLEHRIEQRTADLSEARERLSKMIENAPAGVCLVAPDGRFIEVNPALCAILGRDADTIMASSWQDLTHPDDLEADASLVSRIKSGEIQSYQLQKRYLRPDGGVVWCLLAVSCQRNPDGSVKNFISQISDIHGEVQARETIKMERQHLRATLDSLLDPHILAQPVRDEDGTIVDIICADANPAACAWLGIGREQLLGRKMLKLFPRIRTSGLMEIYRDTVEAGH